MPRRRDNENPEWTADMFAKARPLQDAAPEVYEALRAAKRGRGPQKRPTKVMVALRVDRDALTKYRATGRGWQTRLAATIERAANRLPATTPPANVNGVPDAENPEWTPEQIRTAQPFAEVFPDLAAQERARRRRAPAASRRRKTAVRRSR